MKKKLQFIVIISLLSIGKLFAQDALALNFTGDTKSTNSGTASLAVYEFKAYPIDEELNSIPKDMIGEHVFGESISRKMYLFESRYTYQVPIVPGNPQTRTMIRKPVIYDAVMKIERYLKKSVKKGEISIETASSDFNKVLDVALNVLTAETANLEKEISKTNNVSSMTNLFTKRINLVL
jgi:hypothetical protein